MRLRNYMEYNCLMSRIRNSAGMHIQTLNDHNLVNETGINSLDQ